jgi:formylglycine-generating enzyme required for sulfatase activity
LHQLEEVFVMSPTTADLRQFLTDYFSDEELTTLCFDFFPEVQNSFAAGMSKGQKIQLLIEYVQRREQLPDLLKVLRLQRPAQYAKRFGQAEATPIMPPRPAPPAIETPAPRTQSHTDSLRALRVFLCHASSDKPAVRELYRRLHDDGIDAWLDEEDLLPGQDWQRAIPKAVRDSDVVLVCLSRNSINKAGYVQKEIKFALDVADEQPEDTIFLIPLKLEECNVPERLSRWQWVNLPNPNGYERLMRALHVRATDLGLSISPTQAAPSSVRTIAGIEFARIPAGKFLMGSKDDNKLAFDDEKPQHTVEIPYDYWMARYPVTNDQFAKFVEASAYRFSVEKDWKKKADHPVANVLWHDAVEYCKWLDTLARDSLPSQGLVVRLPTAAEWEKAARGKYGNEWPWGNEFDPSKCNSKEGTKGGTTPVGAYSPQGDSPYGVADMAGNVWEWTVNLWGPDSSKPQYGYPYQSKDGREKLDAPDDVYRIVRGGSFRGSARLVRTASRDRSVPRDRQDRQGFRVVIAPPLS